MKLFIVGFLGGFLVALPPVGPLTLLFYRRLVVRQFEAAAILGGIAAVFDALYTALAAWGYGWVTESHPAVALSVRVVGIALVAALGIRYAFFPPDVDAALGEPERGKGLGRVLLQGVGVAAFNPSALVTWIVVVDLVRALLGVSGPFTSLQVLLLPVSVAAGVAVCFGSILLAWRHWVVAPDPRTVRRLVRGLGVALLVTAVTYLSRS